MSPLKPLYAIAIGFLVVAFVGFGISAFYQEPEFPMYPDGLEVPQEEMTPQQRERLAEYRERERDYQQEISGYNLVVSSISIGAAVLLLVGSILWLSRLEVLGDGVTFGAVLTLFYGLIRAFMTNDEQFRFGAVAVGLVILVALVYWKFSRGANRSPGPSGRGA